jgi:BTB/POZ domain
MLLQAESALFLVREREESQAQINPTTPQAETFDVPDANLIIRSSDLVNFRVHKPVLAMASPVFKDLLSLPQPPDGESVDGLPVVQLSEDSDLLKTLVSMLYPLHPVIPKSYEKVLYSLATFSAAVPNPCYKVLYLLAACQKYEMTAVQSSIRDKVSQGEFPAPYGVEAFSAYAIASGKGLIPEMENAARQTLDHPITFEILGEGLRLSEGWALRDLVNFRKRYRDNLLSCFKSFLDIEESQFNTWTSCASYTFIVRSKSSAGPHLSSGSYHLSRLPMSDPTRNGFLPSWLADLYQDHIYELREAFSKPLFNSRSICGGYLSALQAHIDSDSCFSCTKMHIKKSETLCKGLKGRLTRALNEVCPFSFFGGFVGV